MRASWITRHWKRYANVLLSSSKGRQLQEGESPEAGVRVLRWDRLTVHGWRMRRFLQAPEGGRAGRKRKRCWRATGAAVLAGCRRSRFSAGRTFWPSIEGDIFDTATLKNPLRMKLAFALPAGASGESGSRYSRRLRRLRRRRRCASDGKGGAEFQTIGLQAGVLGTFIICAVALNMVEVMESKATGLGRIESHRVASGEYQPTKSSNMFCGPREYVKIFSPSPQIDKLRSVLCIDNILWSDRRRRYEWRGAPHTDGFWAKHAWARGTDSLSEIKSALERGIADFTCDVEPHSFGRRITCILPNWTNAPVEFVSNRINFPSWRDTSSEYKRSLVSDQGFFSQLTLTCRCNPQCSCECRNYDSGERSISAVMVLNKLSRTSNINANRGSESGWIFFGGGFRLELRQQGFRA